MGFFLFVLQTQDHAIELPDVIREREKKVDRVTANHSLSGNLFLLADEYKLE